jgi:hypothetical protein
MTSRQDDDYIVSPSCVIEGVARHTRRRHDVCGDALVLKSIGKSLNSRNVSFCPQVQEYPPHWSLGDAMEHETWHSCSDIVAFKSVAKRDSKIFLKRHGTFTETFNTVFQDCSRHELRMNDLRNARSVKGLLAFPADIRGLEYRTISLLRQYRKFHIQSVLSSKEESAAFLRARSMSTSRPSRAVARLFGLSDANEVAFMVGEELDSAYAVEPSSGPVRSWQVGDDCFLPGES